jgi:glutamyl-tRNA reductase
VRLEELPGQMALADMVVSSTNSPHHLVERDELELVMGGREGMPMLLVDLAVPRDIDPGCRDVSGVSLYDVDDVQGIAERNAAGREAEARSAERILDSELVRFERWLASLEVVPTIADLRRRSEEIVDRVLTENEGRWESLSEADRARVERLANAIASRMLHEPTLRMKRSAEDAAAYTQLAVLRELFGLDAATEPLAGEGAEVRDLDARRRERRD